MKNMKKVFKKVGYVHYLSYTFTVCVTRVVSDLIFLKKMSYIDKKKYLGTEFQQLSSE